MRVVRIVQHEHDNKKLEEYLLCAFRMRPDKVELLLDEVDFGVFKVMEIYNRLHIPIVLVNKEKKYDNFVQIVIRA